MSNKLFEIMFVEHEQPFYQLSNLPVYKLQCALYEYNEEDFETGVDAIDIIQVKQSYQATMEYSTTGNNHFTQGETISQLVAAGITVSGEVQTVDHLSTIAGRITVSNIGVAGIAEARDFLVSATVPLVGAESTLSAYITKVYDIGDTGFGTFIDPTGGGDNIEFELSGDSILDFTESNPFGDPSENY